MNDSNGRPRPLRFGVFEVDLRTGELRKQGLKVKLHGQPFQVLAMLLVSWFSVKWRVAVFCKLPYSAAARREFSRHGGLSFDEVRAGVGGIAPRPGRQTKPSWTD